MGKKILREINRVKLPKVWKSDIFLMSLVARFAENPGETTVTSADPLIVSDITTISEERELSGTHDEVSPMHDTQFFTVSNDSFSNSTENSELTYSSSESGTGIVSGGASEHHSEVILILTYLFYGLSLAAMVQFLINRIPSCIRPPYAVTLFGLGAFLSYLHHVEPATGWYLFSESIGQVENIDPEIVFFVILPPLLYESGSSLNWHVFRRLMWSALILAFPGVVLNLFFIGLFAFIAFGDGWTLPISFLLGSMLSTTDPVAVVAALHNLHAPAKLALLIDGESLLNDGSAIVGVLIFQSMIETGQFSLLSILDLLVRCALGGCVVGIVFAGIEVGFLKIINKFDHSVPPLETAVIVVGMFLCYLVGDQLHTSGIIAVVSLAISMAVIGKGSYSQEGEEAVHAVVRQLAYFANQLIWLAGGHMTAAQLSQSDVATDPINWIRMVSLFLVLNISRGVSTWIMFPTLTRMGYGLNLKETIMLIYAGLRGAICIALALLIRRSENIPQHTLNEMGFYVAGAVMLTLVVNGSTIESLYRYLKIYPKRTWSQIQLQRAVAKVEERESIYVEAVKKHWFFKDLNLQMVSQILPKFSKAEFNVETGEIRIPMDSVSLVMGQLLDRYDGTGGDCRGDSIPIAKSSFQQEDNGFFYTSLSVRPPKTEQAEEAAKRVNLPRSSGSSVDFTTRSKASSVDGDDHELQARREGVDRLIGVVQLSDNRIKSVDSHHHSEGSSGPELLESMKNIANMIGKKSAQSVGVISLFQCNRPISDFTVSRIDQSNNPFASFDSPSHAGAGNGSSAIEFSVTLPEIGIEKSFIGSSPRIVIGLSPWLSDAVPGTVEGSCGLNTETKEIRSDGVQLLDPISQFHRSEFKRDFVRGDRITVSIDMPPADEVANGTSPDGFVRIIFSCGRYFVCETFLKTTTDKDILTQLHPTIAFLVPGEHAELSFSLITTTSAETRTESNAYILNAAICLYEDLFKAGNLAARSLRMLSDSVEYGIDAANDDLEVMSMRNRIKAIKTIYKKDRGKYEAFEDAPPQEPGEEEDRLSPLETEWAFIQLRHMKRVDCNDMGIRGFFLRLGELFGIPYQFKYMYRKIEELLAYSLVHADLASIAHADTFELVNRLVLTSRSYLMNEVRKASPRDFYVAQHVMAAKILLQIRRKVLTEFVKEGSLTRDSVKELDESYVMKQLMALEDYSPGVPRGASRLTLLTPPRMRTVGALKKVTVVNKRPSKE